MIRAEDLYKKLENIKIAIQENTSSDGTCHFDANAVRVCLNVALSCVNENRDE